MALGAGHNFSPIYVDRRAVASLFAAWIHRKRLFLSVFEQRLPTPGPMLAVLLTAFATMGFLGLGHAGMCQDASGHGPVSSHDEVPPHPETAPPAISWVSRSTNAWPLIFTRSYKVGLIAPH